MLAPTVGAVCLVADLHTPKRFYNMLRVFKSTSPMSIGSWLLVAFGGASVATAAAQFLADRVRGFGWMRWVARATQLPAAATGAGLATYTASLFSATSTPLWAAAPRALAVRFGAAGVATAAAAMGWGERRSRTGRDLDSVAVAALATELAATLAAEERYRSTGVASVLASPAGMLDQFGGTGLGTLAPLALHAASLLFTRRRSRVLAGAASVAILGGSPGDRAGASWPAGEQFRAPPGRQPALRKQGAVGAVRDAAVGVGIGFPGLCQDLFHACVRTYRAAPGRSNVWLVQPGGLALGLCRVLCCKRLTRGAQRTTKQHGAVPGACPAAGPAGNKITVCRPGHAAAESVFGTRQPAV